MNILENILRRLDFAPRRTPSHGCARLLMHRTPKHLFFARIAKTKNRHPSGSAQRSLFHDRSDTHSVNPSKSSSEPVFSSPIPFPRDQRTEHRHDHQRRDRGERQSSDDGPTHLGGAIVGIPKKESAQTISVRAFSSVRKGWIRSLLSPLIFCPT